MMAVLTSSCPTTAFWLAIDASIAALVSSLSFANVASASSNVASPLCPKSTSMSRKMSTSAFCPNVLRSSGVESSNKTCLLLARRVFRIVFICVPL
ncbi:hypothetical protein BKA80DRAFT_261163 [Phyllosticta citrichinensis]